MVTDRTQEAAAGRQREPGPRRSGRGLALPGTIALVLAAGGAAYYAGFAPLLGRIAGHSRPQAAPEPPLPFYLAVKPFSITLRDSDGDLHLVQLGATLVLANPAASNIVTTMLPEIADALRLTVLADKPSDIRTAAGIDKLRGQMTSNLNRMLLSRLGADRIAAIDGGPHRDIIQNVFFSQLFVQ